MIARVTYDLRGGQLTPAADQPWIVSGDPWESPFGPFEADQPFRKGGVDVLIVGSACAPEAKPAKQVTVSVAVGAFKFTAIAFGARTWREGGPGRGLITAWIRRAHLPVGGRVREVVLDIRESLEVVRQVTLRREPDQYVAEYGRALRVYTVYGRESVFADEHDTVVGDLAGLRADAVLRTPAPPALPLYGAPDPVNTP